MIDYSKHINRYCVVRCDRAGVFAGTVTAIDGQTVEMKDCRKLWYWDGAASTIQLAETGPNKPNNCKFTITVSSLLLFGVIEILPCTLEAQKAIKGVAEWKS